MFDMNNLWEKFVLASLRKNKIEGSKITDQTSKLFWQPHKGRNSKMRPDIFMEIGDERIVLDTKWKNLNGYNPSSSDLRQMYVYHEYYSAKKVALVYPGPSEESRGGKFFPIKDGPMDKECSIILLPVESDIKEWQRVIRERLYGWINPWAISVEGFNISSDELVQEVMSELMYLHTGTLKKFSNNDNLKIRYQEFVFDILWSEDGVQRQCEKWSDIISAGGIGGVKDLQKVKKYFLLKAECVVMILKKKRKNYFFH